MKVPQYRAHLTADEIEVILLHWEIGEELEANGKRLDLLLDLLAWWLVARRQLPGSDDRPKFELFRDPLLWTLSLRDPVLFDLARAQVAAALDDSDDTATPAASRLLRLDRPLSRTVTDNLGRDVLAVLAIIVAEDAGLWPEARRPRSASRAAEPGAINWGALDDDRFSENGAAAALVARLNEHPRLETCPEAVPSVAAIRAAYARRDALLRYLGKGIVHAAEVLSQTVHGGR